MISSLLLIAALCSPQDTARVPLNEPEPIQQLDGELVFTINDVGDLLAQITEFVGPAKPEDEVELARVRDLQIKRFTNSIEEHMQPPFIKGTNEIRLSGANIYKKIPSTLIFTGTEQQQAWLHAFLSAHRGPDHFILIETRFLAGPRDAFRDPKGSQGNRFFENKEQVDNFLVAMKKKQTVETVSSPRLTTVPGMRASVAVTNQISYVKSWKLLVVEPGGQEIADPEIGVIDEGIKLDIQVVPVPKLAVQTQSGEWEVPPGITMALHVEIEQVDVERPIPTKKLRLNSNSDAREVEISVPQFSRIALEAEIELVEGAAILIGGPSTEEDRDVAILVYLPSTEAIKEAMESKKERRR